MAGPSAAFKDAAAAGGVATITHIGLVDSVGTELTGGSYARLATTFASGGSGVRNISADLTFEVPAGVTVGGWRGYDAAAAGTDFGGADLTQETYAAAGQYVLEAASTGYTVA